MIIDCAVPRLAYLNTPLHCNSREKKDPTNLLATLDDVEPRGNGGKLQCIQPNFSAGTSI